MSAFDLQKVRQMTTDASRRAFTNVRRKNAEDRFYAFALCADEDANGIYPSANSEEGLLRRLERMGFRQDGERFVGKKGELDTVGWNYYRWNLPEWWFHGDEVKEFRILDPLIEHGSEIDEDDDLKAYLTFRAELYGTMILALRDLDAEGFFGAGEEREAVTLFCDLVEPPGKYWFALESAKRLNPPSVFERFSTLWVGWIGETGRQYLGDPACHSPVYGPLQQFLAREIGGS